MDTNGFDNDPVNSSSDSPTNDLETASNPFATDADDGANWHGYSSRQDQSSLSNVNYHEAAIFVREGENNDKFTAHPTNLFELPAYLITHRYNILSSHVIALLPDNPQGQYLA